MDPLLSQDVRRWATTVINKREWFSGIFNIIVMGQVPTGGLSYPALLLRAD
ncbi:metallopeptidase Mip1 [Aspergillus luchuensis]|uniref:Metallopeptidase Mip1 n=1 Tax=Aspergillus kawachii TaxID=1069201 RepID=A0A146F326_ASPKA|nr:metallopeptidase Mip1 [Aspergillus luchuensis]